jgi:hypothetical protein
MRPGLEHHADRVATLLVEAGAYLVAAAEQVKCRGGQAPGLTRCPVAAGKRDLAQMAKTLTVCTIDSQQFAAPDAALLAQPDTIQRQT